MFSKEILTLASSVIVTFYNLAAVIYLLATTTVNFERFVSNNVIATTAVQQFEGFPINY